MPKPLTLGAHCVPGVNVSVLEDWKEITHDVPECVVIRNSVKRHTCASGNY